MKTFLILSVFLAVCTFGAFAGEGLKHKTSAKAAPHGGIIQDAEPFKVELAVKGDSVRIYVYDKALKPVTLTHDRLTGEVKFPRQKQSTPITLEKNHSGQHYEGTVTGISKKHEYDMHISVEVGTQKALADFDIEDDHEHEK